MTFSHLLGIIFLVGRVLGGPTYQLLDQWKVISSDNLASNDGTVISAVGYDDTAWMASVVPANGTVMATLIQNGHYPDIFYGINYESVNLTQFDVPWWYRTEFSVPDPDAFVELTFKGINYKANVFVNGKPYATVDEVAGAFRYYQFDLTGVFGANNAIALEIFRPINNLSTGLDLAITFVDWAPYPMDNNMGLWQDVVLRVGGPVTVAYPLVATRVLSLTSAVLTVSVETTNYASTNSSGTLTINIPEIGLECSMKVQLGPNSQQLVSFTSAVCPGLNVANPKLWWPAQMGDPNLYTLEVSFTLPNGEISDNITEPFGIREMTSELFNGHRRYLVNGVPILIRGAGWSPDLFQRTDPVRQMQEMAYVRDLGLNAIRLEGKFENENLFDLADQLGILMMPGICCCDAWQRWPEWGFTQFLVAEESVRSQVKRLRIHPSILVFLYSSDQLPPQVVEEMYLGVFQMEQWPNPTLSSASATPSNITGPSGVKMSGPYSWVSPNYWLTDTQYGGAYGFLTEGGPGENPMVLQSFMETIPQSHYWPIDNYWNAHNGAQFGDFGTLDRFTPPLYARYGNATGMPDYIRKSQLAAYEGHRAMFEGYSRNKYTSTGVIQWMLNNAYPENIWHLYDYYLNTGGSYFGTKKACEPLHVMYGYDDSNVWVVNSMYEDVGAKLNISAQIFNISGTIYYSHSEIVSGFQADSTNKIFALPTADELKGISTTYFVRLRIYDTTSEANIISDNFYWLSTIPDVLNENASTWYNTPCSSYADLTELQQLSASSSLEIIQTVDIGETFSSVDVFLLNNDPTSIAFFIQLSVIGESNRSTILPAFWSDNFVTLFPKESVHLTVQMYTASLQGDTPFVLVV